MLKPPSPVGARRSWARACGLVVATWLSANLVVAIVGIPGYLADHPTPTQRGFVLVGLILGPIIGWLQAVMRHEAMDALPTLCVVTTVCVVPLSVGILKRSEGWLGLGAFLWFVAGYLFTIAIWV